METAREGSRHNEVACGLREISERLYFQVARVVLKMMPQLGLVEEFTAFRREMEEVLAAAEIGDWESIGHIRRSYLDELSSHDAPCR